MPPPGIPDWVFPGALVQQRDFSGAGTGPLYAIGVMELHGDLRHLEIYLQPVVGGDPPHLDDSESDVHVVFLNDLLLSWQPTGNYLYPRQMMGEPEADPMHQLMQAEPPLPDEYYRWEDPEFNQVFIIYVEGIVDRHVEVACLQTDVRVRILTTDFMAALARGTFDTPPGPNARRLAFRRELLAPRSYISHDFMPGDIRIDDDGREIALVAPTRTGGWLCVADFDLDEHTEDALEITTLFQQQPGHAPMQSPPPTTVQDPPWEAAMMGFEQMEAGQAAIFRDLMEDQRVLTPLMNGMSAWDPMMSPLTRVPLAGFTQMMTGDPMDASRGLTEMRIGDGWYFEAPNEGRWHIESIDRGFTPSVGHTQTIMLRGDDAAVIQGPVEWVVRNGRRLTPPDPRYTGDPIEVGQVWEIDPILTRQPVPRWRVRQLGNSASVPMVSLEPADNHAGAAIYWPEIRLRAQGQYVAGGRVRRTAFERILSEDDDG